MQKTSAGHNYHFHSAYEVHLCVRGKMQVTVEDRSYALAVGDLCMIAPGKVHYVSLDPEACSMGFRFRFFCEGKGECEENTLFSKAFGGMEDAIVIRDSGIMETYVLRASENMKHSGAELITSSLLFLSLYDLANRMLGKERQNSEDAEECLELALAEDIENYVNRNYNRKVLLADIAAHINLGNRQTERIIKKLFGMTYGELLLQKRIAVARLLLRTTEKTLEEIALACGFEDKAYFCRRFHASVGISPGKYRNESGK